MSRMDGKKTHTHIHICCNFFAATYLTLLVCLCNFCTFFSCYLLHDSLVILGIDYLVQLKELLPSLDLGFMESEEFREFYKFTFQFSREGTHRTIERDVAVPLLQMVSGLAGYFCMATRVARVWINRVRLPILLVVSCSAVPGNI